MSYEITRLFATREAAAAAAAELKEEGFDDVRVVNPPGANADGSMPSRDVVAAWIAEGNVLMADARIYAESVLKGHSLVTVHAAFGSGAAATEILESHGSVASPLPAPEPYTYWDEATPMSSALAMPVLCNDPTPGSRVLGLSPLTDPDFSLSEAIGMPLLSDGGDPGEGRWGFKFLSNNPTPLSSLFGLPVLKRDRNDSL